MAKTATKIKREALPVPQDADEVSDAIYRIGEHQREIARLETAMKDQVAALKAAFELQCQPHADEIKALADGVHAYCEAHRTELTENGKRKFAKFASGEVAWRLNPPKVVTKRGIGLETILELLKARGLARLIRSKEELNKEAVLMEPDAIAGFKEIGIEQSEQFVVKPAESDAEAVV
jgi:phage host-nuclease inhibitor protein Gam